MFTWEGVRLTARSLYIDATKDIRRKGLLNEDFTIISNNCWGGLIYQSYGLPYKTPTIGLFFNAEDYIKFVYDFDHYINSHLTFIKPKQSKWCEKMNDQKNWGTYPIGLLNDVEIHFLHYKNAEDALTKWERRKKRMNLNRVIFKFNDQNFCTEDHLISWSQLKQKNKLCFTCKPHPDIAGIIYIQYANGQKEIKASFEPFGINITHYLNQL